MSLDRERRRRAAVGVDSLGVARPARPARDVPPFQLPAWVLSALADGQTVTVTPPDRPGSRLYTYVPVPLASPLTGAIEISKSLDAQRAFTRATILQAVVATALIVVLCGAIALAAGSVLVARPVNRLVDFSARIARGDFDARLSLLANGRARHARRRARSHGRAVVDVGAAGAPRRSARHRRQARRGRRARARHAARRHRRQRAHDRARRARRRRGARRGARIIVERGRAA